MSGIPAEKKVPAVAANGLRTVIRSGVRIAGHRYGSSRLIDGDVVFVRLSPDRAGLAHIYSAGRAEHICDAICPELVHRREADK